MSDTFIGNLTNAYAPSVLRTTAGTSTQQTNSTAYNGTNGTLEMTDFLMLMVEQFKNQTIDNTADTSDMMNQLVQMSVMESMTQVTTAIQTLTDANVLTYASSLVGKEVTLGVYNDQGELEEITGVVQATGTYEGQQVIFVDDKAYTLNQIMAIGKLPEVEEPEEPEEPGEGGDTGVNEGEETPQV